MHVEKMSQEVSQFLEDATKLAWRKNADYHPDKIAFLEILQTAWETNITVEQDLWARIRKQMSALRRFVIDGHTESESPRSRMMDVAVYMAMLNVWNDNRGIVVKDAYEFIYKKRLCEHYGGIRGENTCITNGDPNQCDRCAFLLWLGRYASKNS